MMTCWSAAALHAYTAHACDKRRASGSYAPVAGRARRIDNLQRACAAAPRTWLHDAGLEDTRAALRQPARGQPGNERRAVRTSGVPTHLIR
jgi:hypothetical protein